MFENWALTKSQARRVDVTEIRFLRHVKGILFHGHKIRDEILVLPVKYYRQVSTPLTDNDLYLIQLICLLC